jgi:carboxylesterase
MPWYRPFRYLGYIWPIRYLYSYREREPFGLKNPQLRRWIAREMSHKDSTIVGASRLNLPAIQEAERMIVSVKKSLPRITAPAIIIHAVEDEVASPRSARHIAQNIGSRIVESVMLHNSYHMITVDNDREQVASETIRFLRRIGAEHAAS